MRECLGRRSENLGGSELDEDAVLRIASLTAAVVSIGYRNEFAVVCGGNGINRSTSFRVVRAAEGSSAMGA